MPLSEEEQRILREIEAQFHADDPKLAREVAQTSVYSHTGRQLKFAVAGLVGAMAMMVFFLALQSILLTVLAFIGAFACGVWAWYSFRRMTKAGLNDLRRRSRTMWEGRLTRNRLRRDEDV
ncbi:MAG: DUF3040 domain-containing protein [Acidimicrobiia bacterium]|nr:DUF3040 domain-containing protein [Acidimicrobiia bacterium]